ncbi:PaaI family thioesterase [Jannaschia seohaensis]|uniref:Uncharacterized domain 1-containing protein n=1 Tax=Jannaschia seohaensis TaxID=475081 RepID=A0A2Y9C3I4_9RHOB|nr:PaaI family thioesterase [Jannaschia seohaensis]PWJ10931.1 uncharacterized protein (TIGR00369 family) [Jannaschia seohaensis]SSA51532.1 uncharacterized domain 1-containing protein [Jannaschia seohaensis]
MFAQSPEELVPRDRLLSLSGLEFLQGIRDGELPQPPIARTLNYRLVEVEEGRAVFRGAPRFEHLNPIGSVHGGWYGTLLDSAMACAVQTMLPCGATYTTLEYKVNITRAIPTGMEILCEGRVQHAGRSTGISHGEIRGTEDGKLYATGSTTCLVIRA